MPRGVGQSTAVNSGVDCNLATFGSDCKHGTHVAGIAVGKRASGSPNRGVAPNANLISINVATKNPSSSRLTIFTSDMIKALERVFAIRNNFLPKRVASINISIGGGSFLTACTTDPRRTIIQQLRIAGIATTISAGNESQPLAISAPACIPEAIAVGSTLDIAPVAISSFSNRGPLVDIYAPGSGIISSVPTSATAFESFNGTSMAAPHVAGAFAALQQVFPSASVDDIEGALEGRSPTITDPQTGIAKQWIRRISPVPPSPCRC